VSPKECTRPRRIGKIVKSHRSVNIGAKNLRARRLPPSLPFFFFPPQTDRRTNQVCEIRYAGPKKAKRIFGKKRGYTASNQTTMWPKKAIQSPVMLNSMHTKHHLWPKKAKGSVCFLTTLRLTKSQLKYGQVSYTD